MPEPRFKPCMQDQPMLLPPDIGDLVPEGSMARVVDMIVRSIDRETLTSLYPGGVPIVLSRGQGESFEHSR